MEHFLITAFISQILSGFFSRHLFAENAVAISLSHQPNFELTCKYLLEILAMSGFTGVLVKKLFALSTKKQFFIPEQVKYRFMMRIISSRHFPLNFSIQQSDLLSISRFTRLFKYDHVHNALIIANESGEMLILFSDGRQITKKLSGYISDVNIVSEDLVVVCNKEEYAHVMKIANGTLIPFVRLGHEKDVNSACGYPSGLFVTGSRDQSVKIWRIDANGAPECLQQLTTEKVNKVLFHCDDSHGDDSAHVIAFSTAYVRMYLILISRDGKKVLCRKCLFAQDEGQVCIAFHPNPKKKILISGGLDGQIIVWRFQITSSNEILIENLVIELPNLKGYWTSSISFHPRLPIVLFCFADIKCEKLPNLTIAVFFDENFKKVQFTMNLREGRPDGGSARAVFYHNGEVLCSDYNMRNLLKISGDKQ